MTGPGAGDHQLRALMASYQAGEFAAFDELYRLVAPRVRRYLSSQARDAARVEDVLQETFLQLHRARRSYDPVHPLMPWVMAIARHCWLMELRRARRRPMMDDDLTAREPAVRAEADGLPEAADLARALGLVPAAQRQALLAHHHWGLSFQEIGARLGIGETAAKLRSSRGVRRLREILRGEPFGAVAPRKRGAR
ncbi:MAG: sigma-70 family RNA polymerase sigma factor [Acidobacteria bacterium]|nr:sigma-70 family RNA polymerase sigma factor [Acidobacteriota bacterium]